MVDCFDDDHRYIFPVGYFCAYGQGSGLECDYLAWLERASLFGGLCSYHRLCNLGHVRASNWRRTNSNVSERRTGHQHLYQLDLFRGALGVGAGRRRSVGLRWPVSSRPQDDIVGL